MRKDRCCFRADCRACYSVYIKEWATKNKERKRENDRRYHQEHREEHKKRSAQYHSEHMLDPVYAQKRRESELAYRERNKDKILVRKREYMKERRKDPVYQENRREYKRKRYWSDPEYRISCSLRRHTYRIIKLGTKKSARTLELLGCDIPTFKAYLESKFLPGMIWDNYGHYSLKGPITWHIDHIIPCAAFDLTDPEQQRRCFHYSNLQPLWAPDNLQKNASYAA